jgi:glycosyltransferase involved in cell wall biosynthesis
MSLPNKPVRPSSDKPVRLLQIIASMNPAHGGPSENAAQISRAMKRLGGCADIATLDAPSATWGDEHTRILRLGPTLLGNYGYSDRLVGWLRDHARKYDAVIVHGLWQYHGLATWRALSGTTVPYYVFPHGMLDPWFKHHFPMKHLKKQLYWRWAECRVLRDAQAVLFTCEDERRLARQSFGQYRVNEAVVGCGISSPGGVAAEQRAAFLDRFPELHGKRLLLFLGRLHPKKGCDLVIEGFAKIAARDPSLHLVMTGPDVGGHQATLAGKAERSRVASRICWTGMLRDDLKWGAYRAADAFILPSHQENFGISVAEALACSVPVIISNKVNIWREIAAAQAGFVGEDTLAGTVSSLEGWLELDSVRRERMAQNALACFREHFHIDTTTAQLMDTIQASRCTTARKSAA